MRTTSIRLSQVRISPMTKKIKAIVLTTIGVAALSACGYQGSYRYECQDPENWKAEKCNPPMCKLDGGCWKELVGFEEETGE